MNSPLLAHLREAGLLNEISDLLTRAKARDEGQLRRYQQQAKGTFSLFFKQNLRHGMSCHIQSLTFS